MTKKLKRIEGTIVYQVFRLGLKNPEKITKLKLSDAIKLAKKLNENNFKQPYGIVKSQVIYQYLK